MSGSLLVLKRCAVCTAPGNFCPLRLFKSEGAAFDRLPVERLNRWYETQQPGCGSLTVFYEGKAQPALGKTSCSCGKLPAHSISRPDICHDDLNGNRRPAAPRMRRNTLTPKEQQCQAPGSSMLKTEHGPATRDSSPDNRCERPIDPPEPQWSKSPGCIQTRPTGFRRNGRHYCRARSCHSGS